MKQSVLHISLLLLLAFSAGAQEEERNKGFKKENLFTGGSVTASFFSGGTVLGANPVFGYKLTNWSDAGVALNYNYSGQRDWQQLNDKVRQHIYGAGLFARVYPVKFIFLQGQVEHNFIKLRYTPASSSPVETYNREANSFLVGAGLAQGRQRGSTSFFYISLLVDVIGNINSPYVDPVYDTNTGQLLRVDKVPIIRAGINVGLFQGRNNDR
jgi:hypothetical protein